jgi:hypothetical protein
MRKRRDAVKDTDHDAVKDTEQIDCRLGHRVTETGTHDLQCTLTIAHDLDMSGRKYLQRANSTPHALEHTPWNARH